MAHDNPILKQHLLAYLDRRARKVGESYTDLQKDEFLFHMTDWCEDLEPLAALYSHPESFTDEQANRALYKVFFHILEHLLAAAQIYDDAPEIYGMLMRRKDDRSP